MCFLCYNAEYSVVSTVTINWKIFLYFFAETNKYLIQGIKTADIAPDMKHCPLWDIQFVNRLLIPHQKR